MTGSIEDYNDHIVIISCSPGLVHACSYFQKFRQTHTCTHTFRYHWEAGCERQGKIRRQAFCIFLFLPSCLCFSVCLCLRLPPPHLSLYVCLPLPPRGVCLYLTFLPSVCLTPFLSIYPTVPLSFPFSSFGFSIHVPQNGDASCHYSLSNCQREITWGGRGAVWNECNKGLNISHFHPWERHFGCVFSC